MEKTRNSNIELLRIMSMFMIVVHHFTLHSGFYFAKNTITLNQLWCEFIEMGGKIGVDVFVIISGYFLVTSKKVKISKVLKLLLQVVFYSVSIYVIQCIVENKNLNYSEFIRSFLPITNDAYWFISAYFILYLLHTYINKLLTSLSKIEYQKMLLLMFILWSVVPSFLYGNLQANSFVLFIFLYAIGGYIRLYKIFEKADYKKMLLGACIIVIIKFLIVLGWDIVSLKYINSWSRYAFYNSNNFFTILISLLIFLFFENIKINNNNFINSISNATLRIYLIHDNVYMRDIIWRRIFNSTLYMNSNIFVLYSILVSIMVFLSCLLIELIRLHVIEKIYIKMLYKIENIVEKYIKDKWGEV